MLFHLTVLQSVITHLWVNWSVHRWRLKPFTASWQLGTSGGVVELRRQTQTVFSLTHSSCWELLCDPDKVTAVRPEQPSIHCPQTSSLKHTRKQTHTSSLFHPLHQGDPVVWQVTPPSQSPHDISIDTYWLLMLLFFCLYLLIYWFSIKCYLLPQPPPFHF